MVSYHHVLRWTTVYKHAVGHGTTTPMSLYGWPVRAFTAATRAILSIAAKRLHPPVQRGVQVGEFSTKQSSPRFIISAKLAPRSISHPLRALIDSSAEQSFIDASVGCRLNIAIEALPHTLQVTPLSSQCLTDITHITKPGSLTLSGNHTEDISLFVFKASLMPLVLAFPWLQQHNPMLNWKKGSVLGVPQDLSKICQPTKFLPIIRST